MDELEHTPQDKWMTDPAIGVDPAHFSPEAGAPGAKAEPTGEAGGGTSISGEFTAKEWPLRKFSIGEFLEAELKVAATVKFSGAAAGAEKPSKDEIQKDFEEFLRSCWSDLTANATAEKGISLKGDREKKVSIAAAVTLKTNVGRVGLEFVPVEISLVNYDPKKGLSGPKVAAGAAISVSPFKRTVKTVELEFSIGGTIGGELTPDYIGIGRWVAANGAEGVISVGIDVAAIAGIPLLTAAVIGQEIYIAGEKGKLDAAIYEGAIDAKQAAFDYASTMTGLEGWHKGPRAKAAVAVAKGELAKIAAARHVSIEALMLEIKQDPHHDADAKTVFQQATQRIQGAYESEVRSVIKKWRSEHKMSSIWTTEGDDDVEAEKKVALIFASDDYLKA